MALQVQIAGDVICVQFDQEEDVALFVPGSSDVLLCSSAAWGSVPKLGHAQAKPPFPDTDVEPPANSANSSSELRAALVKLGAYLA